MPIGHVKRQLAPRALRYGGLSLLLLLCVACADKTPPLPIPAEMEGYDRYKDLYYHYEFDEQERIVTKFETLYFVDKQGTASLQTHKKWTYEYDQNDSLISTLFEDRLTNEVSHDIYEYGPYGRGRHVIIEGQSDTTYLANRIYSEEGMLLTSVSGWLVPDENGQNPEWSWSHERYQYDSLGRLVTIKTLTTNPLDSLQLSIQYNAYGKVKSRTTITSPGDTTKSLFQYNDRQAITHQYELDAQGDTSIIQRYTYYANGTDLQHRETMLLDLKLFETLYDETGQAETYKKYRQNKLISIEWRLNKEGRPTRTITGYPQD